MCFSKPRFLDLPQEIKHHIVEQLERRKDLAACSLAHRSLTWAAQRVLHRAIEFSWIPGCGPASKNKEAYSNPEIATFVHKLSLTGLLQPKGRKMMWAMLARLTNVKELILSMRNSDANMWSCITPEERDAFRQTFPNVKTLEIESDFFCHVEDFLFFLSAFPNVTTLRLYDVHLCASLSFGETFPKQPIEGVPCSQLRHLDIRSDMNRPEDKDFERLVQQWIIPLSRVVEPGFAFKWYDDGAEEDSTVFAQFIQAFAPTLVSLEVNLSRDTTGIADFGIRRCDKLESVSLMHLCRQNHNETDATPDSDNAWALGILSHITSTRVRTITLGFSSHTANDLAALDLERVKDILLQPHLANATITLILPGSFQMPSQTESQVFLVKLLMPFYIFGKRLRIRLGAEGPTRTLDLSSWLDPIL